MAIYDYNKSIEQIAASLAHEVKNPLSLVRANIDLLELTDVEIKHKKNYRIMRQEIEKINDLLLDFIQLTKPVERKFGDIHIISVILDIIDTVKVTYSEKVDFILNFLCNIENDLIVCGDEDQIRRVFLNIIKNAYEAIETKGIIKINISEESGFVKLVFEDNGKGMDKDELKKINTPFYTTKEGGSGLGLYISRSTVESHGGKFDITGESEKGCVVTIMLPVLEAGD